MNDDAQVLEKTGEAVKSAVEKTPGPFVQDPAKAVIQAARRAVKAQTGRRPVILAVINDAASPARRRRRRR